MRLDLLPSATMYAVWKRIEANPWLLDDSIRDPYSLAGTLAAPTSRVFFVGFNAHMPDGVMYAHNVVPGVSACTGISIWNPTSMGSIEPVLTAMRAVVREAQLHKLYAHIAAPNRLAHRLAKRCGFVKEGELREALCYRGKWTDVWVYGVLADELGSN